MNIKTVLGCSLIGLGISLQSLEAQGDFGGHRDPAEALTKPDDAVVLPTEEEITKQVAQIRESSLRLVAHDADGWDDLWLMVQRVYDKNYKFDPTDKQKDTDGDGMSDYEEMLVHRDATRREPVYTKEQMVQMVRLSRAAKIKSERENLKALLPRIEAGLRAAEGASPAVLSEEETAPAARRERLLDAAEALLNQEESRKKREVKRFSAEARELLKEAPSSLLLGGASNGMLELIGPDNLVAAQTMATNTVWPGGTSTAPDVTGSGQQIGIWEAGGGVFGRHQEFMLAGSSRVAQIDSPATEIFPAAFGSASLGSFNFHATQVAGVLAASGGVSTARGMAYESTLAAYGSGGDIAEMMAAAATGMKLSNHSYSLRNGWLWAGQWVWLGPAAAGEDPRFGLYQRQSREIDIVAYENPRYLSLWSSGNEGAEVGPVNASGVIAAGTQYLRVADDDGDGNFTVTGPFTTTHPPDSGAPLAGATPGVFAVHLGGNVPGGIGTDTLKASAVAKNNLSIGAIEDIAAGYTQPSDVGLATFSSRGPTDDGRVKPDLVANGTTMLSPTFSLGAALTISNNSFETPLLAAPGLSQNGSTGWSEDTPGSGSAQTTWISNFAANQSQVFRLNTANYRVWQDLTTASLTANTQYVLSVGLGKLTGTTPDTKQVKVAVYTNGFNNLLAEQTFSPGKLTPFTNDPGAFGDFQLGFFVGATVPSGTVRVVIQNLGTGVAFADNVRLNAAAANLYATDSGTSFSTPAVTGSLALLQQQNTSYGNNALLASTWKALLINNADDGDRLPSHYNDQTGGSATLYPGPDFYYGWGLVNTRRAAETLAANQGTSSRRTHLREHTLFNGNTTEILVEVGANTPRLQVTLCWTDPAFQSVNAASGVDENLPAVVVDSAAAVLINDLDLKVVRPEGGSPVQAWKLNPAAPRVAAVRGDNTVDTVEQVTVVPLSGGNLTPGTYKLQISHKGSLRRASQTSTSPLRYQLLTGEYQRFSVAVSGNLPREGDRLAVTSIARAITGTNALVPLTWTSVQGLRYRVQRSLDLQSWTDVGGDITATGAIATTTVTEGLSESRVFYRIKEVNP